MTRNTLLLFWLFIHFSSCSEDFSIQIDEYRDEFVKTEDQLWESWSNYTSYRNVNQEMKHVMEKLASFEKQYLNKLPQNLLYGVEHLRAIRKFMDLQKELILINYTYDHLKTYRNKCLTQSKCQFDGLIDLVTNSQNGVIPVMSRIHDILYEGKDCISNELHHFTSINSYACENIPQSAQQLYYNFYNLVAMSQLKAYILLQITNLIKFLVNRHDKVSVLNDSMRIRHMYKEWVRTVFHRLLKPKSREIVRCDPNGFIKGVNYDQFTRLLQGHIENEVDMSQGSTCKRTCNDYYSTTSYRCYQESSEYCQKVPRCNGYLRNCFFVESKASICISKNPERRYEFVTYESGKTLGRKTHCSERRTVNSWTRWFVQCNYCMCLCDDVGSTSHRHISMRPAFSDTEKNMVVTGIRFKKRNRILHLQILQGKLLPYGRIDPSTVRWVEVDYFNITKADVFEGTDYIILKYDSRNMALDTIDIPNSDWVVTGVYFSKFEDMIQLNMRSHQFDWKLGTIKLWSKNTTYFDNRIKIDITKPDVPVRTSHRSTIHTAPHRYVQFTNTDFDKDAAQSTIPFIDLQDVVTVPPVPLSGVGIAYRGNEGYGGFITPKITTYDYGRVLKPSIPDKPATTYYEFEYEQNT